jgi:hypothetical protein
MSKSLPTTHDAAPSRLRRAVTTVLMIMLAVMIVRDIFARRWGSTAAPRQDVAQDVTQRSPCKGCAYPGKARKPREAPEIEP